jgi:hypothetical protein
MVTREGPLVRYIPVVSGRPCVVSSMSVIDEVRRVVILRLKRAFEYV